MYEKEEKLKLNKQIAVTDEVYEVLREQKKECKMSMAKIVCNLVLEKYGFKQISAPKKIKDNK